MLDGTLTANIQPEGLVEGDTIVLATTTERSDPVLKGHVEAMFGAWDGLPIQLAHAALNWPSAFISTCGRRPTYRLRKIFEQGNEYARNVAQNVQPLVAPKGAPERFNIGRLAEATDFASWADLADLLMPQFRNASAIPASGPLHDEVEHIRAATSDPMARAKQALALVQDRIRYVALKMGQGGYVPASAEQTWCAASAIARQRRRCCSALFRAFGIEAEPVLVSSSRAT